MKRYETWEVDLNYRTVVETDAPGGFEVVLYPDVADLERRHSEAVGLLRSEQGIFTDDEYDRWDNKRIVFLAEEKET